MYFDFTLENSSKFKTKVTSILSYEINNSKSLLINLEKIRWNS
jgi:hypothetical protein